MELVIDELETAVTEELEVGTLSTEELDSADTLLDMVLAEVALADTVLLETTKEEVVSAMVELVKVLLNVELEDVDVTGPVEVLVVKLGITELEELDSEKLGVEELDNEDALLEVVLIDAILLEVVMVEAVSAIVELVVEGFPNVEVEEADIVKLSEPLLVVTMVIELEEAVSERPLARELDDEMAVLLDVAVPVVLEIKLEEAVVVVTDVMDETDEVELERSGTVKLEVVTLSAVSTVVAEPVVVKVRVFSVEVVAVEVVVDKETSAVVKLEVNGLAVSALVVVGANSELVETVLAETETALTEAVVTGFTSVEPDMEELEVSVLVTIMLFVISKLLEDRLEELMLEDPPVDELVGTEVAAAELEELISEETKFKDEVDVVVTGEGESEFEIDGSEAVDPEDGEAEPVGSNVLKAEVLEIDRVESESIVVLDDTVGSAEVLDVSDDIEDEVEGNGELSSVTVEAEETELKERVDSVELEVAGENVPVKLG